MKVSEDGTSAKDHPLVTDASISLAFQTSLWSLLFWIKFFCSSSKGHCSHGQQLYFCSSSEVPMLWEPWYAQPKQKILGSHSFVGLIWNHVKWICLVHIFKATLQFKSRNKWIEHFKHQVERIKHLFTYRYMCKQFLSIKRTLQINMKHHTFIILVIQNTFLSQPHCTTLDNRNLEKQTSQMLLTVNYSQFGNLLTPIAFPKTALPQQLEINGPASCSAFSPLKWLCLINKKHILSSSSWPRV